MRDHHIAVIPVPALEGQKQMNTLTLIYILSYMERTILSLLRHTAPTSISIYVYIYTHTQNNKMKRYMQYYYGFTRKGIDILNGTFKTSSANVAALTEVDGGQELL